MEDAIKTSKGEGEEEDDEAEAKEKCDDEVWETLSRGFRQAQSVLDQNRALIQQVNDNHRSKVHDNLAENVSLIHQINGNISKVLSIYSDLSVNFSTVVHQRRSRGAVKGTKKKGEEDEDEKAEN